MEDEFIPANVAADLVGCTATWVRSLQRRGIIRSQDFYGRKLVSLADLMAHRARVAALGNRKHALRYQEAV